MVGLVSRTGLCANRWSVLVPSLLCLLPQEGTAGIGLVFQKDCASRAAKEEAMQRGSREQGRQSAEEQLWGWIGDSRCWL